MKLCKFQNVVASSSKLEYRDIFKIIFGVEEPKVYVCPYVRYKILHPTGYTTDISDLYFISKNDDACYIIDLLGDHILLTKDNFKIICCSNDEKKCPYSPNLMKKGE